MSTPPIQTAPGKDPLHDPLPFYVILKSKTSVGLEKKVIEQRMKHYKTVGGLVIEYCGNNCINNWCQAMERTLTVEMNNAKSE